MASDDSDHRAPSSATSNEDAPNLNPDLKQHANRRSQVDLEVAEYVRGIKSQERGTLSRAITLIESTRDADQRKARSIVDRCVPAAETSIRVAVTGVPGVGKSTFIDTLGQLLVDQGRRLAVLTVDPTSERSKGSILGDKTRMRDLSTHEDVFVRPSPTAGTLGGVARKTREAIILCEAAGYDTLLVETVGVGQAEVKVHSMVDFFLLLALAGAGDELQGIKRGIVEMADAIAINKADGENRGPAEDARAEYERALHLLGETESGWEPPVLTCSAITGEGVREVWEAVQGYRSHTTANGFFETQRRRQARHWMYQTIERRLREDFFSSPAVDGAREQVENAVLAGELSSFAGADQLLQTYHRSHS